jgi:GntR family transcriptional regulator / MocR family aminotransferase
LNETSQPVDLLLAVDRGSGTLGAQIEDQLRRAIRSGALRPGTAVPSTRDLARQVGVSRRVVVDAYAQLAAEGYLLLRQGARPRVSETPAAGEPAGAEPEVPPVRYDFRPAVPDVSTFPRRAWLRSVRDALSTMTDADLGYGDPRGVGVLRAALADYLGRVRGVVAEPSRVMITCGYSQGLDLVCRTLARSGGRSIAFEDPSYPEQKELARRAGLEPVPVPVDEQGLVVDALPDVDAVVLTPAHQHPTGVVLTGERRTELLAWLRDHDAIAIDDDYDAEYRYDRAAVGALQGLDPEHVVYAGSASKTLAPALRLGWIVLPASLVAPMSDAKRHGDHQTDRIEQHAFADFLVRGELDRHLRRMRASYRARRDALVAAIAEELPETTVSGIAAGLHATVRLPDSDDEAAIVEEARRRRIEVGPMAENWADPSGRPPTLLLGYGQIQEAAIRPAVRALADAVMSVRS